MALVNIQKKFGDDPISGRGLLGDNSPLWVATIRGVTTGSPHSQNGSPTTGLGLSLEAGPSVTGV